jgi:hypothetical protein
MPTASVFWQRSLRILGVTALAVLGVAIVVLGLFMLPPVRNAVLAQVVEKAKAHLPGEFAVTHASWPSVGAIGLRGVLWTANGDTLVAADTLIVEMSVTSFFRRDLHAHRIIATGVSFDLPALRSSFPSSPKPANPSPKKERRFPRPGALPGVPSMSAETIILRVHRARFTPQWTLVESELEGGCDLSAENGPKLVLTRLVACTLERKLEVQMTPFHFDGRAETMNGDVTARLDSLGTLVLHVASLPPDSLRLIATLKPDGEGSPLQVDVRGRLAWDGQRLESYGFEGNVLVPGTDELARWPAPFRKAAVLSPLPPLSLRAEGVLAVRPQFSLNAHVTSKPVGWLEGLEIRGAYGDKGIQVDTLRAAFPGLRVTASGARSRTAVNARLDAQISDGRWLKIVMPHFESPESLVAGLHLSLDGPRSKPGLRVDLAGGFRRRTLSVREVTVSGQFPEGLASPGTVSLSGVSRNLRVSTRATLVPQFPLEATVSPLRLEDLVVPGSRAFTVPPGEGRVQYDGSLRQLRVDSVRMFGDWGTARVDGNLAKGSGEATTALEFSSLPEFLRRFMTLPDSTWSALEQRWRNEGPFTINARSRISGKRVSAQADFSVPGPSTLRVFLPRNAQVDDLGPLRGHIDAELDTAWTASVDLSPTEWLMAAPLHLEGSHSHLAVDTLRLGLDGSTITAAAFRENGIWAATGNLQVTDARVVRRFVPAMTAKDSCTVSVGVHVHDRDLIVEWKGAGRYHDVALRQAAGHVFRTEGQWGLDVGAQGLAMGTSLKLDRLSATLSTQSDGREAVRIDGKGPTLAFATSGVLDRRNGLEAQVDTLRVALSDKELHATQPFVLLARQHGEGFGFEDVDLEGTMGSVKGHGELVPGASVVDLRVALDLEGLSPPSPIVSAWWPERLEVSIVNEGSEALSARASVAGLRLRGESDWVLEMTARGDTSGLTGEAHVRGKGGDALSATYFSPGIWQLYPFRIEMKPEHLEAEATLNAFPVPWQEMGLDASYLWPATANGHFVVNHDAAGPYAREDLEITLTPPDAKERPIHFSTQGVWVVSSEQIDRVAASGTTPLLEATEARIREMNHPGITASFALSRDTKQQLSGSFFARLLEEPNGAFVIDPQTGMDLTASAPRFDLATLRAFLPPGYSLSGNLRLDARLTGSPRNPALSGTVDAPAIALQMNDGGRLDAKGKLQYSGTLLAPIVEGRIDIKNGVIPVPEQPRKLHAVSGKALLWQTGNTTAADSTLAKAQEAKDAATDTTGKFRPVYDLQVVVPSGLWIRGRNLNVELEGDLRLRQQHSIPTVVGNLEARQGTLNFVGRSFSLERGKVQFYGEDEINPGLDIRLSAKISSTTAYVTMSGTLKEPKVELTSSPSMSEADIMSLLVMGKTADDLNGDQAQLVAQRAAAVAATYGAAELQKKMAGPLGVDMITLNPGGGPEGENSVVVGKYLSPRALLKYEQALDSAAGFFVTLEYTLTQTITLQTIAGTWQSGAEISWSKDY